MNLKIDKTDTLIDAKSALDLFGKDFRFDHVKGLAEWVKNSVDAYLREEETSGDRIPDSEQLIIIRFRSKTDDDTFRFECIDFCGTTHERIQTNFKKWFDRLAAKVNGKNMKTYGGHGNGGKFYMRQMFETSYFMTYRSGIFNAFGFDKDKDYGFVHGLEKRRMGAEEALEKVGLTKLFDSLPVDIKKRFRSGNVGFTVVSGHKQHAVGKAKYQNLLHRLRVHPQARNLVSTKQIFGVFDNGALVRLEPEDIPPKKGFESPVIFEIPSCLPYGKDYVELANDKFPRGKLSLYTSEEPFNRYDDRAALNCINFKSQDIGIIASYRISEMPGNLRNFQMIEFIYGECECPILEDPNGDCVKNDREKLVDNDKTRALFWWICERINDLTNKMVEQTKQEQQEIDLKNTSIFNDFLIKWKNNFMQKVYGEIFGGLGSGDGGGFGEGEGGGKKTKDTTEKNGHYSRDGSGTGDKQMKGNRYPIVLLSNHDDDPLNPGNSVPCDIRHPLVYQRPQDFQHNIYWINTQAPLAQKLRDQYGTEHVRWREYMFQRYVEIILKQTIHELEKRGIQLTADELDNKFDDVYKRVYQSATEELAHFLFSEKYEVNAVGKNETESAYSNIH